MIPEIYTKEWFTKRNTETYVAKAEDAVDILAEFNKYCEYIYTLNRIHSLIKDQARLKIELYDILNDIECIAKIKFDSSVDTAYTDGNIITLGSKFVKTQKTDSDKLDIIIGLMLHEACHCKYTDWKYFIETLEKFGGEEKALIGQISNIIEDELIETKLCLTYGGYANFLEKLKYTIFNDKAKLPYTESGLGQILCIFFDKVRYPKYLLSHSTEAEFKKYEEIFIQIYDVLEATQCFNPNVSNTTKSSISAAIGIVEILKKYFDIKSEIKTIKKEKLMPSKVSQVIKENNSNTDNQEQDSQNSNSNNTNQNNQENIIDKDNSSQESNEENDELENSNSNTSQENTKDKNTESETSNHTQEETTDIENKEDTDTETSNNTQGQLGDIEDKENTESKTFHDTQNKNTHNSDSIDDENDGPHNPESEEPRNRKDNESNKQEGDKPGNLDGEGPVGQGKFIAKQSKDNYFQENIDDQNISTENSKSAGNYGGISPNKGKNPNSENIGNDESGTKSGGGKFPNSKVDHNNTQKNNIDNLDTLEGENEENSDVNGTNMNDSQQSNSESTSNDTKENDNRNDKSSEINSNTPSRGDLDSYRVHTNQINTENSKSKNHQDYDIDNPISDKEMVYVDDIEEIIDDNILDTINKITNKIPNIDTSDPSSIYTNVDSIDFDIDLNIDSFVPNAPLNKLNTAINPNKSPKYMYSHIYNKIKKYIPMAKKIIFPNNKKKTIETERYQRTGQLDPSKLADAMSNVVTVYNKKSSKDKNDDAKYAVVLLLDESGSMMGKNAHTLSEIVILLYEAISSYPQVELYIYGYGDAISKYITKYSKDKYVLGNRQQQIGQNEVLSYKVILDEVRQFTKLPILVLTFSDCLFLCNDTDIMNIIKSYNNITFKMIQIDHRHINPMGTLYKTDPIYIDALNNTYGEGNWISISNKNVDSFTKSIPEICKMVKYNNKISDK